MKKKFVFICAVIVALLLCACGPKVKMDEAKNIAVKAAGQDISSVEFTHEKQNTSNGVTEYELTFSNDIGEWTYTLDGDGNITGSTENMFEIPALQLANPSDPETTVPYDPFNAYENIGVDQKEVLQDLLAKNYIELYDDSEDVDKYVYPIGLSSVLTESDESSTIIVTEKGEHTPIKIYYLDRYKDDPDMFAEDFRYLQTALENQFGEATEAYYTNSNDDVFEGTAQDYVDSIHDLKNADLGNENWGYVTITYDSGDTSVALFAEYDALDDGDLYTIHVDIE